MIYFFDYNAAETGDPNSYEAVETEIEDSGQVVERLRRTLARLVRGASQGQRDAGLVSPFDDHPEASVEDVLLRSGAVIIDFSGIDQVLQDSNTSSGIPYLVAPIYLTAFQFPEVQSVELRSEGSCAAFHGALGGSCGVMTRADHEAWIAAWSE